MEHLLSDDDKTKGHGECTEQRVMTGNAGIVYN